MTHEAKLTPGPWSILYGADIVAGNKYIATISRLDGSEDLPERWPSPEEAKGNASLIVAAPDLLAVLKEVEAYLDDRADADCDQDGYIPNAEMRLLVEVTKAINKAESRAP